MTFSFYHSLMTLPAEFDELSRSLRLTRWMRFWKIEVPAGAIGLVWNGMMSMAGAWFFLSASEAISSNGKTYPLPGVGSYAAAAIAKEAFKTGKTVRALCLEKMRAGTLKKKDSDAVLREAELNAALDPRRMTEPEKAGS